MLMTKEVAGIELGSFEVPIETALPIYSEATGGSLEFDVEAAKKLDGSAGMVAYSAKSASPALYLGEEVGKLIVVAFAPGDGMGDAISFPNAEGPELSKRLDLGSPPVIPMSKPHTILELMFNVSSHRVDAPDSEPLMFANDLELLGLKKQSGHSSRIGKVDTLGDTIQLGEALAGISDAEPQVSTIVDMLENGRGEHDPSAVFNPYRDIVQVGAFLAISDSVPAATATGLYYTLHSGLDNPGLHSPVQA